MEVTFTYIRLSAHTVSFRNPSLSFLSDNNQPYSQRLVVKLDVKRRDTNSRFHSRANKKRTSYQDENWFVSESIFHRIHRVWVWMHARVKIYAEMLNLWTHPEDCQQYTTGPRAAHWIETSLDRTMLIPALDLVVSWIIAKVKTSVRHSQRARYD